MHDYAMLADGDRVLVAVSGGIDSLVLTWLLAHWQRKAPIRYHLLAAHLDMGFGGTEAEQVAAQLRRLAVPFLVEHTGFGPEAMAAEEGRNGCFHCARRRRNRLFELAREQGCSKVALGHHREDIIETFFLNMFYSGNLSTMVPRQELFEGRLALIRPMAYLDKEQIRAMGAAVGVTPVANPCPLSEASRRSTVRTLLADLYAADPRIKGNIFAALGNIRFDYLLNQHPTPPHADLP